MVLWYCGWWIFDADTKFQSVIWKLFTPCCWYILCINKYVFYKLITVCYVLLLNICSDATDPWNFMGTFLSGSLIYKYVVIQVYLGTAKNTRALIINVTWASFSEAHVLYFIYLRLLQIHNHSNFTRQISCFLRQYFPLSSTVLET